MGIVSIERFFHTFPFEGEKARLQEAQICDVNDSGYLSSRREAGRLYVAREAKAFGFDLQHLSSREKKLRVKALQLDLARVSHGRDRHNEQHSIADGSSLVRSLFVEALKNKKVRDHATVQMLTRGNVGDPGAPAKLLDGLVEDDFPEDLMIEILQTHEKAYGSAREALDENIETIKKKFIQGIQRLKADRSHPLTDEMISDSYLEQEVRDLAVGMADPLEYFARGAQIAEYRVAEHAVMIPYDERANRIGRYSAQHEIMHAISGKTIVRDSKGGGYRNSRIGMTREGGAFWWLNEAIAETLALDLYFRGRDFGIYGLYRDERSVYRELIRRVPEKYFLAAFFENTPVSIEHGNKLISGKEVNDNLPKWRELRVSVYEEFGRDLLGELDRKIQSGYRNIEEVEALIK